MFIVKKVIGGKEYYYLRKSERVNGKVKAVTLAYLGKSKKEAEKKRKEFLERKKDLKERKRDEKMDEKAVKKNYKKSESRNKEEREFVSFVQEAGLIWGPSPEIYGGVAGFYTYGPIGKLLKHKVEESVRRVFNSNGLREIEGPTVVPDVVWEASGHLKTFVDRTIRCSKCKNVFRADKLIEESYDVSADSFSDEKLLSFIKEKGIECPSCKGKFENKIERQSLMMKTKVAGKNASLRPETATVTYLPYPSLYNYFRKKIPFGVFQIGKAYRNEVSPRQGVLRGREFTQAEGQIFIDPEKKNDWEKYEDVKDKVLPFWDWKSQESGKEPERIDIDSAMKKYFIKSKAYAWCVWLAYTQFRNFGIPEERIRLRQHAPDEKAFYAEDAWDIEVKMNSYGWIEVCGVHDRTDYDLKQHSKASGITLEGIRENGERFVPHILEIAFGTDRPTYALIDIFYDKKSVEEGKTIFKIPYNIAPVDVSIFPLMKKPNLLDLSEKIKEDLEKSFIVDYDVSGSIGKRYLRAMSVGTPFAVTVDFDSLEKNDVTIRDRDTGKQQRFKIENLQEVLRELLSGKRKVS